jgi:hypothetical protein
LLNRHAVLLTSVWLKLFVKAVLTKAVPEIFWTIRNDQLGLEPQTMVRRHNASGCDLCNRTGISGRTLLLDALMVTLGPAERDKIYKALMRNVNDILLEEGLLFIRVAMVWWTLFFQALLIPNPRLATSNHKTARNQIG